ncbi:desulfoferrodoxin [Romboutsia ilealis]|uniref:Desulfoferrodoxin n=1 Tax=Romboutsia faecis TaxID=2764597 RepID=A0ABR7JK56_9FIRM|nr:desulfoferrodoxin family protein [Romboutsia faecis]MBC5995308.1 desulfoferrodoxin [Romboutsia faecis]MRN24447.1 desulfoferrodoxin [Romboutsia ilealis]
MNNTKKFFICSICGNLVGMVESKGPKIVCCGKVMNELVANTTEASVEKHIPVVNINDNKVKVQVGSTLHPMTQDHHISWIYVLTKQGGQRKCLDVNSEPIIEFALTESDKILEVYSYCNLHGLWKVEL